MKMSPRLIRCAFALLLACFAVAICHAQLVIDNLDGEVTQNEVDTFISVVSASSIPTSEWTATITHNQLADGNGGQTLEAINYMYQITGDIPALSTEHTQLLNLAIKWNDAWLTHRNDMPLGEQRVMWTGKIEPVWPPNCPTCSSPTYYESEVGDTIGHMAFTAYNILNTPSLWNNTVPDGDPNNFGATYLARAKTYVSMLEFSMSNSFTKYYIDPNTLLIMRPSTSLGYLSTFHNVNAWNVQMMLLNAYWRLAQCHVILADNPSLAATYKTIVQKSTDMFTQNAISSTAPDGTAVYDWGYGNFGDVTGRLTGEQIGVHGSYDVWGLTRAYSTGYTTLPTAQQMKTYADTVVHEMTLSIDSSGAATYASFNDRCCDTATYNYLPYGFIFLTPYNTGIYKPAATADINSGRQKNDPGLTAGVLWAKHWIFVNSNPDFSLSAAPATQTVTTGGSTSYTATVMPSGGFTGAIDLSVSGLPSGAGASFNPASISNGSGSSTLNVTNAFPAGNYTLTITGTSASLNHSSQVTLVVNPSPTTTAIASNNNPSAFGQTVTLTATVSPANATGTVQFNDGNINLGSPVALSNGRATLTTSSLSVGVHSITGVYSGDANFLGSTSSPLTQTVSQAGTSTILTSDIDPSNVGQSVTFIAAVTPASATGAVQFNDGNSNLGSPVVLSNGTATFATSSLTAGTHNITASYSGDSNYLSGASAALTQAVMAAGNTSTTTTMSTASVRTYFHQQASFLVQVTPTSGTATGSVILLEGSTQLGPLLPLDGSGKANYSMPLRPGTHNIQAVYTGNGSFSGSSSSSQTVNASPRPNPR